MHYIIKYFKLVFVNIYSCTYKTLFTNPVIHLAKFIPNLSQIAAPLRTLLEKDTQWHWQDEQEKRFKALKQLATKYFDPSKHTKLSVQRV